MIGCETPGKTQNGCDDGDSLVSLQNWQITLFAQGEEGNINLLMIEIFNQRWEEKIELNGRLERGLQADLHHPGRGVENLRRLNLLLSGHFLGPLGQVVFPIVVVLDEEDGEGPEGDAAEESDGVKDQSEGSRQ